jgi:hypothetical protein
MPGIEGPFDIELRDPVNGKTVTAMADSPGADRSRIAIARCRRDHRPQNALDRDAVDPPQFEPGKPAIAGLILMKDVNLAVQGFDVEREQRNGAIHHPLHVPRWEDRCVAALDVRDSRRQNAVELERAHGMVEQPFSIVERPVQGRLGRVSIDAGMPLFEPARAIRKSTISSLGSNLGGARF